MSEETRGVADVLRRVALESGEPVLSRLLADAADVVELLAGDMTRRAEASAALRRVVEPYGDASGPAGALRARVLAVADAVDSPRHLT